ncbi:MAG: peptidoglycan DD-metalloendopeptidase family protein [Pseudomonadota bacterium]
MRCLALIVLLAILAPFAPVAAQQEVPAIDRARTALEKASKALKAASGNRARLAALGQAVAAHEAALAAYRQGLRSMATRESRIRREILADREKLDQLVSALQSLGRAPRSALLAFPGGPVGAARGAGLMAEVSPELNRRIDELKGRLDALSQLRTGQEVARVEARGTLASLQELRRETATALRKRKRKGVTTRKELRAQAEAAQRQARNLDDLAATLEGAALTDTGEIVSFSEARGLIPLPVRGALIGRFGDLDPWGRQGKGLSMAAPAYSEVSAPWDGTIRYAGPLIDYGQVVVLEPEEGTLLVLAGLAVIDRVVGETVLAGERLGDLGGPIPDAEEFLLEASTDRDQIIEEVLYIELRRGGRSIDPASWFQVDEKGRSG